ncbi:MAG: hypothetical protein U5L73_10275 [Rhodoferax sp.]|uniref:hypothetical protein n=1 Tax=Rhodoferax sp. TaxID=50421 RepID=UPI002ACD8A39|nr:hypothetical protein [Rhodoferax sp.]MDZ7892127.1 hypothetical protein [Rhodoferax sp.]
MKSESLATAIQDAADQATPLLNRAADEANAITQRGLHAVQDSALHLREKANRTGEATARYIQQEPVKSVLLAAATGAVLMGVISLLSRPRNH